MRKLGHIQKEVLASVFYKQERTGFGISINIFNWRGQRSIESLLDRDLIIFAGSDSLILNPKYSLTFYKYLLGLTKSHP
jgi:hypothetical protein